MAKRPVAPPLSRDAHGAAPRARRVDVREWLGGIRLSGFMVIMLGLVVLAAFVLVPTVGTYVNQRQQITALEQSIRLTEAQVVELEAERDRWNDPAYITTQARERLYYQKPGELVYLVDNDLASIDQPEENARVSPEIKQTKTEWMTQFVGAIVAAGAAQTGAAPNAPTVP